MSDAPLASVIVPVRNGMPLLADALRGVLDQVCDFRFEVLVVDSGSSDGSWEAAGALGVRRLRIAPPEYNHGATRNWAAARTAGELLVFLVQDAIPADPGWLRALVGPLRAGAAAASYGRQLPRPETSLLGRQLMAAALPQAETPALQQLAADACWERLAPLERLRLARFDNTNSCIRRDVHERLPFRALAYGEDIEWAARAVRSGLAIAYQPQARIFHSHDRSPWYQLKRSYADHRLMREVLQYSIHAGARSYFASGVHACRALTRGIWREPVALPPRLAAALRLPLYVGAALAGGLLAAAAAERDPAGVWGRIDAALRRGV
jgi:rhamnosyltransferase